MRIYIEFESIMVVCNGLNSQGYAMSLLFVVTTNKTHDYLADDRCRTYCDCATGKNEPKRTLACHWKYCHSWSDCCCCSKNLSC